MNRLTLHVFRSTSRPDAAPSRRGKPDVRRVDLRLQLAQGPTSPPTCSAGPLLPGAIFVPPANTSAASPPLPTGPTPALLGQVQATSSGIGTSAPVAYYRPRDRVWPAGASPSPVAAVFQPQSRKGAHALPRQSRWRHHRERHALTDPDHSRGRLRLRPCVSSLSRFPWRLALTFSRLKSKRSA